MRGLLKSYGIKRVYILGAGFSAPLGLPLTRDLLRLVYGVAERKPWYLQGGNCSPHGQADWILEKINWYFPLTQIDHKSIVSGKTDDFDLERFLSYVAASSASGERWNEHGDKFVSFLKSYLAQAVVEQQEEAMSTVQPAYLKFADAMAQSLVISFNWDTVLETLLDRAGRKYAFDLQSTWETDATPIIKLKFSRTSRLLLSDTSTFRGSIAFRWSATWTASYPHFLKGLPPARNELSTGNRYFWHVWVNTPFDWSADVAKVQARTLLVFADADSVRPEHMVEFWKALGGGQRDAGIDGSLRPANQFAIVPNATHYTLVVDPMLPKIVERFLGTA